MNVQTWNRFLEKVSESPELCRELAELALRHGIDFSQGELAEDELGRVSGGAGSVSDLTQMQALALQDTMQKQQQAIQMMSNISKMVHDSSKSIISNLKG